MTDEVLKSDQPVMRQDGDHLHFKWANEGLHIFLKYAHQTTDGIHCEIEIHSTILAMLHWGRINLLSTSGRETLVKKLRGSFSLSTDWVHVLDRTFYLAYCHIRAGSPITALDGTPSPSEDCFQVDKLLPAGQTTVIFGDGGTGKSLLALAIAASVNSQISLPCGLSPIKKAAALYLDYEEDEKTQNNRLHELSRGLGISNCETLYYRPMFKPIWDDVENLKAEISKKNIGLVVVDSLAPAFVNPNDPEMVIRSMNALRAFSPASRLVISHISKADTEKIHLATPYGSVYIRNLARSVWEVRRASDDEDELSIALYHRKVNNGRLQNPFGLRFEFNQGMIKIHGMDLLEHPDLLVRAALPMRIIKSLSNGSKTVKELSEETVTSESSIRGTLNRLRNKRKVIRLDDYKPPKWGIPALHM